MIAPPLLKTGDRVGIVATARKVSNEEIAPALEILRSWGLIPVEAPNLYSAENQFSGSDAQRTSDLQGMLNDPTIRAIFTARGGYGTVRILDNLDFSAFAKQPKWITGYSDVTVLHSHIHANLGIQTLHSTMCFSFTKDAESLQSMRDALFGTLNNYVYQNTEPLAKRGTAMGELVGGNLSILVALNGSVSDIDTKGKILFLEDLDEYLYHIDRMMLNLKRSGKLTGLKGLIIGGMTDMRDNPIPFGKTVQQIISETVREYNYPVAYDFPAGHGVKNMALYFGRQTELIVSDTISLRF